jgi:hypothetical protein
VNFYPNSNNDNLQSDQLKKHVTPLQSSINPIYSLDESQTLNQQTLVPQPVNITTEEDTINNQQFLYLIETEENVSLMQQQASEDNSEPFQPSASDSKINSIQHKKNNSCNNKSCLNRRLKFDNLLKQNSNLIAENLKLKEQLRILKLQVNVEEEENEFTAFAKCTVDEVSIIFYYNYEYLFLNFYQDTGSRNYGHDVIITDLQYALLIGITKGDKGDGKYINQLLKVEFGSSVLEKSSLTGQVCRSVKNKPPSIMLDPRKINIVRGT